MHNIITMIIIANKTELLILLLITAQGPTGHFKHWACFSYAAAYSFEGVTKRTMMIIGIMIIIIIIRINITIIIVISTRTNKSEFVISRRRPLF